MHTWRRQTWERHDWLRVAAIAGMLAGFALAPRLWIGPRIYPLTPVWAGLKLLAPAEPVLFFAAVALLLVLAAAPRRGVLAACIALLVMMAVQDQSRWQPWFYQYLLLLVAAGSGKGALNTASLIVASTYVWSGLGKLNPNFAGQIFASFLEPLIGSGVAHSALVLGLAPLAAFVESAIGVALFTRRLRTAGLCGAIALHTFILFAIGPAGHRFNVVVWPWNGVMIACLLLVFYRRPDEPGPTDILWQKGRPVHVAILVLVGLMPALNFFDGWDDYLSAALYTANGNAGAITFPDAVFDRLPDTIQDFVTDEGSGIDRLDINSWSFGELNVPAYPEIRIYRNALGTICGYAQDASGVRLVVERKYSLVNRERRAVYDCQSP